MDSLSIRLRPSMGCLGALLLPLSCGVGTVALWWHTRSWPSVMDQDGITLRSGRRVYWRDCTEVIQVTARTGAAGARLSGRAELLFGGVTVRLVPQSVEDGPRMLEFATERLGHLVRSG